MHNSRLPLLPWRAHPPNKHTHTHTHTGCARAAEPAPAADSLKPVVGPGGAKLWKTPLAAARANNLTSFAAAVADSDLTANLTVPDFVGTIFAPSERWGRN